jgi:2-keto-4-pentenoate hydratase/2-oxohepta-3-ene-1,7-dioic acid hydratase in catechol pathway
MKLLTFHGAEGLRLGLRTEHGVVDIADAGVEFDMSVPQTLADVIAGGEDDMSSLQKLEEQAGAAPAGTAWLLDEMGVRYGPAVAAPGKIICIGLNYRRHAVETNAPIPEVPVLFSKYSNTVCASGDNIPLPPIATQYDYEVELGVVIGKQARNVAMEDALSYVLGYVTANDISVRDLQMRTSQWLLGKTLDNFLPVGPYLVTADEIGDPQTLRLRCWVNDDLRQDSSTGDMIFSVAEIISYISRYFTLEPGDLIITGTPEGVAMGREEKPWLKPGDEVVAEVDRLGRLKNLTIA